MRTFPIILAVMVVLTGVGLAEPIPLGLWELRSTDYTTGRDRTVRRGGTSTYFIRSVSPVPATTGWLQPMPAEYIDAAPYRGHHVHMSLWMRTADVKGEAAIVFGAYARGESADTITDRSGSTYHRVAFVSTWGRGASGTRDWTEFTLDVNVPSDAAVVNYALGLYGTGTVWVDGLRIQIADR